MFYSSRQSSAHGSRGSHITMVPSYTIVSLTSNISEVNQTISNDAYTLLKALLPNAVSQSVRALPTQGSEALEEQMLATAVKFRSVGLLPTILELNTNMNLRKRIMMEWSPTYPLIRRYTVYI